MSDWFTDLVTEACTEVVASGDIQAKLVGSDCVTAQSLTDEIISSAETIEDLRAQFPDDLEEWQRIAAMHEILDRQSAVESARARLREGRIRSGLRIARAAASMPLRLIGRTASVDMRRKVAIAAAETSLEQAMKAYEKAFANPGISRNYSGRQVPRVLNGAQLAEERRELSARLLRLLTKPLRLQVNAVIHRELAASYVREFSYTGSAYLADHLDDGAVQVIGEANRVAIRAIQGMIDGDLSGAVGVAGPRGIGKTTLLCRFARRIGDDPGRWGVCVAAPAQYDARDFLLYLFGQLCASVLGADEVRELEEEMTGTRPGSLLRAFPFAWLASCAGLALLLCGGAAIGLETARPVGSTRSMTDLLIAGCCAAMAVVTLIAPEHPLRSWLLKVEEVRQREEDPEGPLKIDFRRIRVIARLVKWSSLASGGSAIVLAGLVAVGRSPNPGFLIAGALAVAVGGLYLLIKTRFSDLDVSDRFMRRLVITRNNFDIDYAHGPFALRTETPSFSAARDWYKKVKFQQSYTTGWSGTVTLAPSALPVQAQAGWSESKALAPLAMSVPEIVAGFQSFTDVLRGGVAYTNELQLGQMSYVRHVSFRRSGSPIPVVIGIDEVDKIEDPQAAQAFFNQIKGLFGDSRCLFLISISDDAMAAYERRGLPLRDAFDSSLSTVIPLSYLSRQEARTLIGSRLVRVTNPSADLLYVLSGGLPRELVRFIRRAVELQQAYLDGAEEETALETVNQGADGAQAELKMVPVPLDVFTVALIADQIAGQRRAVLIRGRALDPCAARDGLLAWAADPATALETSQALRIDSTEAVSFCSALHVMGEQLLSACDGAVPDPRAGPGRVRQHADSCAAQETGAFLHWLATVGQTFLTCATRTEFEDAENPASQRSFDRLARIRQNFPLGPGYIRAAVDTVRDAWNLH